MIDLAWKSTRRRPPHRWCPLCQCRTKEAIVLAIGTEVRDHQRSGDIARIRTDGIDRWIFVTGRIISCAACQFPHAYEETQR